MIRPRIWSVGLLLTVWAVGASASERAYETVGHKLTAIPLLNFSSDDGTGYGLRLSLFGYDGVSVPYRTAYSAQAFFTTRGKWVHRLYLDVPSVRPGQRIEIELLCEKEDFANYYGGLADERVDTYPKEQKTFKQNYPKLIITSIRDIRLPWRLRAGFQAGHNSITPNTTAGSILTDQNPPGADGGTLFQVNAALQYDTRDNYVNSTRGLLEELLVEYGFGSGFNGAKVGYEHRHFRPLLKGLVFAHRTSALLTFGDLPFYEEPDLGGSGTLRGLPATRWRGEGLLLLNAELRWQGLRLSQNQHIYLGLLLFGDAGQAFNRSDGPSLDGWKAGGGAGLRFHWHSTVVRADYGLSGGKTGIYITFSQVF